MPLQLESTVGIRSEAMVLKGHVAGISRAVPEQRVVVELGIVAEVPEFLKPGKLLKPWLLN